MKNTARFITEITVTDPDSKGDVGLSVFKHDQGGGMFAIDSSYLDQCFEDDEDPVIPDPFMDDEYLNTIGPAKERTQIILHGL